MLKFIVVKCVLKKSLEGLETYAYQSTNNTSLLLRKVKLPWKNSFGLM